MILLAGLTHSTVSWEKFIKSLGLGFLCTNSCCAKMSSFRFNFGAKEDEFKESILSSDASHMSRQNAEEIKVLHDTFIGTDNIKEIFLNEKISMKVLNVKCVEERLKAPHKSASGYILDASLSNTDLVPDVYEGGLKVWECAVDLVEFLQQTAVKFKDQRVLELGCGAGLPGIFGLLSGAVVDFQDFNREVIENFTIPNVFLNLKSSNPQCSEYELKDLISAKCRFFAGDWKCLENYINPDKEKGQLYDMILTSETIYDTRNQKKLFDFIRSHLRHPFGIVYLAAKTCYFGVGGGTRAFERLVNESNDFFITVSKIYHEGVQREVLMMTWKE